MSNCSKTANLLSKKRNKGHKMKLKLLGILFLLLSFQALAKHNKSIGCASLALGKEVATKIALIRARSYWVEHYYGRVVSGQETLLVDNNTTQLAQTIKTKSVGLIPSLSASHFKKSDRVKEIDGKSYFCVHLQAVK
jgi:hypothetical protein